MKRILLLWCLTVAPCLATPLVNYENLLRQYGPKIGNSTYEGVDPVLKRRLMDTNFRSNGLDILVVSDADSSEVISVEISRQSPFNGMEIPDILKPLSTEDWTQKDDKTWVIAKSKVTAQWNGEGKISIGSD